jgi:hypothetical protein
MKTQRKSIERRAVRPKLPIKLSPDAIKLLEYIDSIGISRSSFNLLRSSESRLRVRPPSLFRLK